MAITQRTLDLTFRLRAALAKITDAQTRQLVSAWADAWSEVEPDLTAALLEQLVAGETVTRAQLLRSTRLRKALEVIAQNLRTLSDDAGVLIIGDLQSIIDAAGGAQASVIDSQLPPGSVDLVDLEAWSRVDERHINAIVKRSTQQITSTLKPLAPETYQVVRQELIRGVISGSNPRETARRMVARAEQRFNGQLGLTRALAISRTEMLDASRAGGSLGRMQHADVLRGWEWHCELSTRSCPACIAQHGSLHPLDEPGPNDHVCGRCTGIPVTRSWAELGIEGPEPVSLSVNPETWFESQSVAVQTEILGPGRYDAWTQGIYPMSDWGRFQENPDWRTSLQTTNVPKFRKEAFDAA